MANASEVSRNNKRSPALQEGWVIANHILVSFHVAFISSILALPAAAVFKAEVLRFVFVSWETLVSALFMATSFHVGIALHELGHFISAARLNALNESAAKEVKEKLEGPLLGRFLFLAGIFLRIPYGKAPGVKREGLNYYPDAPYNLAVAAAGPRASRNVAMATLPFAAVLIALGLALDASPAIYVGRLLLGIGLVSFLDFRLADPGKYAEFRERESLAREKASSVEKVTGWLEKCPELKRKMMQDRIQEAIHPLLGPVTAPWQFRNCGMGGRHTEKEYPESNISMQEAMFLILSARDYQDAQELTVRLQNRLKEIIEKEEGCRVMGIGLEGGLAPYIEKGDYPLPEVRLWAMMKQAIAECGCRPGVDVAIALDPAMSELENAYRAEFDMPDSVGMYLFWRDKAKVTRDRDSVLDIYIKAIEDYEIPILSIEDGFSEDDFEGWKLLLDRMGDRIFVIGDDLVTTNDQTIETAASQGLINTALIKANQIGSLYETLLAMLVALGKGLDLVVSHRSKSPNDDMEAQIALAVNSLGLKAGGGANTERLIKYQSVTELMLKVSEAGGENALRSGEQAVVRKVRAYEEPTNAGIPTVGVTMELVLPAAGVLLKFRGSTPLGTSAGTGEAIHLVDAMIEKAEHREAIARFPSFFEEVEPGVFSFGKSATEAQVRSSHDEGLTALFERTQRYKGKGCLNAADNVLQIIAPHFEGRNVAALGLKDIDSALIGLELSTARRRGKLGSGAGTDDCIHVMQRKQNLGMNAMLSSSLALARAIAHVQGKELYELLREEMLDIIDGLADSFQISVQGSRFGDYVTALREVNRILEEQERPLYEALREQTGIYTHAATLPEELPTYEPSAVAFTVPDEAFEVLDAITAKLGSTYRENAHHGFRHSEDLLFTAARIAQRLEMTDRVDWRVLAAAVGLHDAAASEQSHSAKSAELARHLWSELDGFAPETIDVVEQAIALHGDRSPEGSARRESAGIEAQLLYDADQIEAFGVKGIYRYIAVYAERKSPFHEILEDAQSRFGSLTFDAARELAEADYSLTVSFMGKLLQEGYGQECLAGATGVVNWICDHVTLHPGSLAEKALDALRKEREAEGHGRDPEELRFAEDYFNALRAAYGSRGIPEPAQTAASVWPIDRLVASDVEVTLPERFTPSEKKLITSLNSKLYRAYIDGGSGADAGADVKEVFLSYLNVNREIARRVGHFGIVNNRIFKQDGCLLVPYLLGDTLILHAVRSGATELVSVRRFPRGAIYTDRMVNQLADADGVPIDLEESIFTFNPEQVQQPRIARIRDIASLLQNVNETTNRNEALYLLRCLVARLCNLTVKTYLGAKNLQPEVNNLNAQLLQYLNGWLCRRLPGLTRIIVRNLSSVIGKPNLIDRLWNDTIRLAEVEVRGSAIVNEVRRSSHHALGRRTLLLAEAYLDYLVNGETAEFVRLGVGAPGEADVAAREREEPRMIVERVVEDLGRLLGTSETVTRIQEWQESYAENLLQCQFGNSIRDELDTLITKGIRARNRWGYYHHIRILQQKIEDFSRPEEVTSSFKSCLESLQELRPDDEAFDSEGTERMAREGVEAFADGIKGAYQEELFSMLGAVLGAYEGNQFFETFLKVRELRKKLRVMIHAGGFPSQRYFLYQLDCLLEEMSYLALRHIATAYAEEGVELEQCIEIISTSILNLEFDGLFSRELYDLAGLLRGSAHDEVELLDVLQHIGRNYHKLRRRVAVPYEKMRERLGLDEEDLRIVLANMQRYMHDLNSMVHFSDIAGAYIRENRAEVSQHIGRSRKAAGDAGPSHTILHISHRDELAAEIENGGDRPTLRGLYGGKGSSLLYVSYLNLPTRDGFILPTSIPRAELHRRDHTWLEGEITVHLRVLENDIARRGGTPKRFGDESEPLVLAVRGGSVFSMPGILSTIVFVGMNDRIAEALAKHGPWRAYDSYRRFLASYAMAVWDLDLEPFNLVDGVKSRYGVEYKTELPWKAMQEIAESSKGVLRDHGFADQLDTILKDPMQQLFSAVRAVYESWNKERACRYRDIKGISHTWQTAAIVQEMAFGNGRNDPIGPGLDETQASLTGVVPRTNANDFGIRELTGEIKFSAAGDDLVGGITSSTSFRTIDELDSLMPMLGRRLKHVVAKLRRLMGTDQEVEFTVESGVLSVLQSRTAETGAERATDRFVDPGEAATRGLGVRGGGFRGMVAFDEADREELAAIDFDARDDVDGVLMVLENPTPEEIPMIISADGLLTSKGGSTSHAAVAINGIEERNFCAVMSASGLHVDIEKREAVIVDNEDNVRYRFRKGDILSLHGTSGEVYIGSRSVILESESGCK